MGELVWGERGKVTSGILVFMLFFFFNDSLDNLAFLSFNGHSRYSLGWLIIVSILNMYRFRNLHRKHAGIFLISTNNRRWTGVLLSWTSVNAWWWWWWRCSAFTIKHFCLVTLSEEKTKKKTWQQPTKWIYFPLLLGMNCSARVQSLKKKKMSWSNLDTCGAESFFYFRVPLFFVSVQNFRPYPGPKQQQ